jgi:uracil-DNA glycosylase
MDVKIENSWKEVLSREFEKEYFTKLVEFVKEEYKGKKIFPPANRIFSAFEFTPFNNVRVVILGQDPYHGEKQANGLSFSVNEGVRLPPSLQNIFKELKSDIGIDSISNGDLSRWAKQGVLLLNSTLTVQSGTPGSHQGVGWEQFTDEVISHLNSKRSNIVFILWGNYAKNKGKLIDTTKHFIISSPHPSPFSAHSGFFGSKPFSRTNEYLKSKNIHPILW